MDTGGCSEGGWRLGPPTPRVGGDEGPDLSVDATACVGGGPPALGHLNFLLLRWQWLLGLRKGGRGSTRLGVPELPAPEVAMAVGSAEGWLALWLLGLEMSASGTVTAAGWDQGHAGLVSIGP
jgi:hypothetical protein